ncbi:hypothetical protein Pmani_012071 [Petrolisthes manimaculis]|uniref:Sodium/potassium-transporting ATPase subunit beta-2 n=1 Tax=Petrolisthes manimaculis TaxID=1843537 RepID=A0AAE1UAV2_9EUCA|nr:hypothetical protein Pmani_012071 [Petrolisthes manimaculis]
MPSTNGNFTLEEGGGASRRRKKQRYIIAVVVVTVLMIVVIAVALSVTPSSPQPGITIYPSDLINYKQGGLANDYTRILDNFIAPYEVNWNFDGISYKDCNSNNLPSDEEVCIFQDTWIGDQCKKAERWGYTRSTPCILLTPNKVVDWVPEVYEELNELPVAMPQDLKDIISNTTADNGGTIPKMVWVWCEAVGPVDREYMGPLQMSPWHGFPQYYFPYIAYQDEPSYLQPIVALQFRRPMRNVVIALDCKMWAKNINPNESVARVELFIE